MSTPAESARPGALMAAEIAEQPSAMARLLALSGDARAEVVGRIRAYRPRFVLLAARGTSDHAALYAKYLVEITLGLPAGLVSPSTFTVFGARPDLSDVLWIAVSQSGGSTDLVTSTEQAGERGALTLAVTNAPGSPLAAAAALHLDVHAGVESAVAATKSYTNELLSLYLLVDALAAGDGSAAAALPELAAATLGRAGRVVEMAARLRFARGLVVTGRGYSYPTAREAALKLMETSYLSAHAFSAADLMHGPLAMIDMETPVIVVAPSGVAHSAVMPALGGLAERGGEVLLVTDDRAHGTASGPTALLVTATAPREELAPLLGILPLQQLAQSLAVARGLDPDAPRGLAKVTQTH